VDRPYNILPKKKKKKKKKQREKEERNTKNFRVTTPIDRYTILSTP